MRNGGSRGVGRTWLSVGGFLLLAGAGLGQSASVRPEQSAKSNMNGDGEVNIIRVGRFQFPLPPRIAVTGRSQSIYDVDVTTVALPSGDARALWEGRLTRIRALGGSAAAGHSSGVRTFDLLAGVPAVWYAKDADDPGFLSIEAVKPMGNHAILAQTEGASEKQSIIETLVRNVIDAYVPEASNGFCLGYGSITSKPSLNEHTRISFASLSSPKLEIKFETQTVRERDTRTYSNLSEETELVTGRGGHLAVLRDQPRVVSALEGKEMWILFVVPGEDPFVRFTWHFAGVAGSSSQPSINIVGTAPADQQVELESAWTFILTSLRAVPASPQPIP